MKIHKSLLEKILSFPGFFSFRSKILIFLTLIPILCLSLFLKISSQTFQKDKVKSIYNTSRQQTYFASNNLSDQFANMTKLNRALFQNYISTSQIAGTNYKSISKLGKQIQQFCVFQLTGSAQSPECISDNLGSLKIANADLLKFANEQVKTLKENTPEIQTFNKMKYFVLSEVFKNKITKKSYLTLLFSDATPLKDRESEYLLVDQKQNILIGRQSTVSDQLFNSEEFDKIKKSKIFEGVFKFNLENDKTAEKLVAYSKLAWGPYYFLQISDKKKMLQTFDDLRVKSIFVIFIFFAITLLIGLLISKNLTKRLDKMVSATEQVSNGNFSLRLDFESNDEVGSLAKKFNIMTDEIKRLIFETQEKSRMESELAMAKTVQSTLFPAAQAQIGEISIAGYFEPASECGGDWWHYYQIKNKIYFFIGDATGHGVSAALLTSAAKSAATLIELAEVGPSAAMQMMNRAIFSTSGGKINMTFFIATLDMNSLVLTYTNSSHEFPIVIPQSKTQLKKEDLIFLIGANHIRLGELGFAEFTETSYQLKKGEAVLFYTDGVIEINNLKQESRPERLFTKSILNAFCEGSNAQESVDRLVSDLSHYRAGAELPDDVTLFAFKT